LFDTQSSLGGGASIDFAPPLTLKSGANNRNITNAAIEARQGYYVLIHTTLSISNPTGATGTIKLKNFVFRTSRVVGSSTSAPAAPVGIEIP
jgi:hypothetical protein